MAMLVLAAMLTLHDAELYYEIHGDGPPLLLIAGLASDSQSWGGSLPPLAEHFRVICPDNRGVGRSRPANVPVSIERMADDCAALVRHLGYEHVDVLGHSMGGFVAQSMAARHPELVGRLVLAGTGSKMSARNAALFSDAVESLERGTDPVLWFRNLFYWLFSTAFFEQPGMLDAAVNYAITYPWPQETVGFRNQVAALIDFDGTADLERIAAPALVLSGSQDLLFPVEECREFAGRIAGSSFHVIEGAAHSIHMERSEAFVRAVVGFLTNQRGQR
jgi:pimeloyl-ACP methyl ester carboxylesterase